MVSARLLRGYLRRDWNRVTANLTSPPQNSRAAVFVLAAVAAGAFALFALMARHGLDLTDEGFYLLNFRHWNSTPVFTLFGAYLQLPYRLLDESLWAMRVLGAVLLICSGTWCARELILGQGLPAASSTPYPVAAASIAAGMTAFNYYGGFLVPYTPSYNTLALISALTATALTMRTARTLANGVDFPASSTFALGLVISIGVANKFSAGALVALVDAALAAVILWRRARWRRVGIALAIVVAGCLLNIVVLAAVDPDVLTRFRQGIAIQMALLPRDVAAEYLRFISAELPRALSEAARMLIWPTAFAIAVLGFGKVFGPRPWLASVAVSGFLGPAMYLAFVRHRSFRIEVVSLVAVLLWSFWTVSPRTAGERRPGWRTHAMAAAVLAIPFAYSFGTNNVMLDHMAMAAV